MKSNSKSIEKIIDLALEEDIGVGDVTCDLVMGKEESVFYFVTREDIVVCGTDIVAKVFKKLDKKLKIEVLKNDGQKVKKGTKLIRVSGLVSSILTGERVALNFFQHMTGIATNTSKYVNEVAGTRAKVLDTRKTIPGHRLLEKYAVKTGGGMNHRMGLYDGILIKDNHIAICGSIKEAVRRTKKSKMKIEVECDNLEQVKEAIAAGADRILLDNMSVAELKAALKTIAGRVPAEASGGVNLKNIKAIAKTGVDFISVGALTHSAPNADIGLDMVD